MKTYGNEHFLKCCYYSLLCVCIIIAVLILLFKYFGISISKYIEKCALYETTGLYCPGCGGTRSVIYLLKGDFISSLKFHPFVLYGSILFVVFMISHTASIFTNNRLKGMKFRPVYFYIMIVIIIMQWLYKNAIFIMEGVHII